MRSIRVSASVGYDVVIGEGILNKAGELAKKVAGTCTAVIVSDDIVWPIYGETVKSGFESCGMPVLSFVIPHGENSKCMEMYEKLLEFLCASHITRGDMIAALGGGVVGDLAGFAAATYQRGIKFIQIPTTLLAAVDSSVGGKTAVNLKGGKNQAGCFYQPSMVICDTAALKTLPEEEYKCGCAEVIKYGVIEDEEFFRALEKTPVSDQLEHVIETCVSMKRDIVNRDEFDRGDRMLLNFGHTLGHAVEKCSGYKIRHGQAVAIGMVYMAKCAAAAGLCGEETVGAVVSILEKYGLPTGAEYSLEDMAEAVLADKKSSGGYINLIIPERIGKCRIEKVTTDTLKKWMKAGGIN